MTGEVTNNPMQCHRCGVKQAQYPRWLCRACDVAAGTFVRAPSRPVVCRRCGGPVPTRERLCAVCWAAGPRAVVAAPPPIRERVIGGRVYVVVWDGAKR